MLFSLLFIFGTCPRKCGKLMIMVLKLYHVQKEEADHKK